MKPTKDAIYTYSGESETYQWLAYQGPKLNLSMTRFNPATRDIQPTNDEIEI